MLIAYKLLNFLKYFSENNPLKIFPYQMEIGMYILKQLAKFQT